MKTKSFRSSVVFFLAFALLFQVAFAVDGGGLFGWLGDLAQFIKRIFVPDSNYFHNQLQELNDLVNSRFGGLAYLYLMLNNFFLTLNSVPSVGLMLEIPDNFFFSGYQGISIDFFSAAYPYISMLRNVLTSALVIFTAIICYHKLRTFFSAQGGG